MFSFLKTTLVATALLAGNAAIAKQPPWERPQPKGMTAAHVESAAQANKLMNRVGDKFNGNAAQIDDQTWKWQRGRNTATPIANMDGSDLNRLITGRYYVNNVHKARRWSVWYMNPNGTTHFCIGHPNGKIYEYTLDRYVNKTPFGMSGILHWNPKKAATPKPNLSKAHAFPFVANPRTGQISISDYKNGKWYAANSGWFQDEYAAAFAERCPNLPRSSKVNNNQTGRTIQEIARGARPITGFRTAFDSDPMDPLTVEMLYWAHPPR